MQYLEIVGGKQLHGEITVQGSKNAALPILAASLLGEGPCVIENCPRIQDVEDTLTILRLLGCDTRWEGTGVCVDASCVNGFSVLGAEAERIRSSVLFLGALLGRMGRAQISYPGGCSIGKRPIDLHLEALRTLGVRFLENEDSKAESAWIQAETDSLRGGHITLPLPSVGATENVILAAVAAEGETWIDGAAREPEIDELCLFLRRRGADVAREKNGRIRIRGGKTLSPVRHRLNADRIVAGTYLLTAVLCGGCVHIRNLPQGELGALTHTLKEMGVKICENGEVESEGIFEAVRYLKTAPYPGFPTDLQAPLMAVLCTAHGKSTICETIFENRFRTAQELRKMGAVIETEGRCAVIEGVPHLHGSQVQAFDLRGGAALTAAALAAQGHTVIHGYGYIARGYEDICRDFHSLGADIYLKRKAE